MNAPFNLYFYAFHKYIVKNLPWLGFGVFLQIKNGTCYLLFKTTVFSWEILKTFSMEIILFLEHICFFIAFPY